MSLRDTKPAKHGRDHAVVGEDPIPVAMHKKVISDTATLATGDGQAFIFVTEDCDGGHLIDAEAFLSTASTSGVPTIQLRRMRVAVADVDMLATKVTIDANEYSSYTGAAAVVDTTGSPPKCFVQKGDRIAIDVDVAGAGAKGLEVVAIFGRIPIPGP